MTKRTLVSVLLALVAALAVSSTALAKGGGGGGGDLGTSCARIVAFAVPVTADADCNPLVQTTFTVSWTCVDHELTGRVAIDYYDGAGTFTGRSFWQFGGSTFSWSSALAPATPGATFTEVLSVYLPNGKVADQRSITITIPAA